MVPEGWALRKLSEVATVTSGGTPSKARPEYWEEGTIPWARTTEVQNGILNRSDIPCCITELGLNNSSAKILPENTILMAMIGQGKTRGQVALLKEPASVNQNCAAIIINGMGYSDFYYQYFLSQYSNIRAMSNSAGQSNLSAGLIKEVRVPLPPLAEQKKIAKILSTWDEAIATTEQLLANNEQQKKALMQQLLTGKKRLPGFEREWRRRRIGDFLMESREPSNDPDPSSRLTVRLNMKGVEKRGVRGTESKDSTAHFVRHAGQFIYGKQNVHKGAFGIIPKEFDGFQTSQDLPAFDFSPECDPEWFLFFFSRPTFYSALENKMSGTGSKRLKPSALYKVSVLSPDLNEQREIGKVLASAQRELTVLSKLCVALKQEKKALMQQLLTGKRRVKVDEAERATA